MCKYEMDPMNIVEDTERTRFCPQQTDGRTDRRTDGQGDTSIPPFQLRWSGGYNHENISDCAKPLKLRIHPGLILQLPNTHPLHISLLSSSQHKDSFQHLSTIHSQFTSCSFIRSQEKCMHTSCRSKKVQNVSASIGTVEPPYNTVCFNSLAPGRFQ